MPNFDFNAQAGVQNRTSFHGQPPPSRVQHLQDELSQLQAERKPLNITVGAEFEMMLVHCTYPEYASGDLVRDSIIARLAIYQLLREPLSAPCATCGELHTFQLPVNQPLEDDDDNYNAWSIVSDCTIILDEEEKAALGDNLWYCDYYQIGIRTRILPLDRPQPTTRSHTVFQHTHSITAAQELELVLNRLNTVLNGKNGLPGFTGLFAMLVNKTCGLHVHVGNGYHGFPLHTVKNVVSTYVANERAIDAMHAENRIGGSTLPVAPQNRKSGPSRGIHQIDAYNMPWSAHHSTSVYNRREKTARGSDSPMEHSFEPISNTYPGTHFRNPVICKAAYQYSAEAQLTLIQHAPSKLDVFRLQGGMSHNSTVELANISVDGIPHRKKNTIEFRQHAGTTQPVEVLSWIDFVASLVRHAHDTPDEEYANLCLGCSDKTQKHYKQKLGMRSNASCYANQLAAKQLGSVPETGAGRFLAPLQEHIIEQHREANDPANVRARINEKFLQGGYGQFTDAYLSKLLFVGRGPTIARERLRVGYVNPATRPASPKIKQEQYAGGGWNPLLRPDHQEPRREGGPPTPLSDASAEMSVSSDVNADGAQHIEDVSGPADQHAIPLTEVDRSTTHPYRVGMFEQAAVQETHSVQASHEPEEDDASDARTGTAAPRARPLPPVDVTTSLDWNADNRVFLPSGFRLQPPPQRSRRT
ncbi:hypothetical protein LTR85_010601 [Meristemomyces frigidus]|nr:hypothetical protein LTR85_010601 [Meristemomyces frigidus]